MNLHEFQAKELLSHCGIQIPHGRIAESAQQAERVAQRLGAGPFVIKPQIHAGDRASNGGVRMAKDVAGAGRLAKTMIDQTLITSQTGPRGQRVRWVYVEQAIRYVQSIYCAVVVDATRGELVLLTAPNEDATGAEPIRRRTDVTRTPLQISSVGVTGDFARAAEATGIGADRMSALVELLSQVANAALLLDASLIEINPLAAADDGRFVALDAKIVLDDNALFRHPDLAALRDVTENEDGDPSELAAQRHQINYLKLDGNIGVIVNGAGLALATLDELADAGGAPANFMDIRTTASSLDIAYGLELLAANPRVKVILVNVHGGGMQRCDTIAEGIGIAMRKSASALPIVVRFAGNNAEFVATRLLSYGLPFTESADMWEAVNAAVAQATRKAA